MQIVLWRTQANGSILNRLTSPGNATVNDSTVDNLTILDNAADAAIAANEVLYTGRALSNVSPPAARYAVAHKNRIFLLGMEDPQAVWPSRKYQPGDAINFSDSLALQVPPWSGPLTGGASMDEKLILFQKTATGVMFGDGPNDLGAQSTWTPPERILPDVGCVDARTIVTGPFGVVFLSAAGFYLLDRGLQPHYIGGPVENVVNPFGAPQTVFTSAVLLATRKQVRWTSQSGICVVLDYTDILAEDADTPMQDRAKWHTFTGYWASDATLWRSTYVVCRSDNVLNQTVEQEVEGVNQDTWATGTFAVGNGGTLETGWIKLSNVANFQRVRRVIFTGSTNLDTHTFQLSVGYDYNTAYAYTSLIGPLPSAEPLLIDHKLQRQKCAAVRFLLRNIDPANTQRWSIDSLTLECGLKKGPRKTPATAKFA